MWKDTLGILAFCAVATLAEPPVDRRYLPKKQQQANPKALQDRYSDLVNGAGSSSSDFIPPLEPQYVAPSAADSRLVGFQRPAAQFGVSSSISSQVGAAFAGNVFESANTLSTLFGLPSGGGGQYAPAGQYNTFSPIKTSRLQADDTYSAPYGVPSGFSRSQNRGTKTPRRYIAPKTTSRDTNFNKPSSRYGAKSSGDQFPLTSLPSAQNDGPSSGSKYNPAKAPPTQYGVPSSSSFNASSSQYDAATDSRKYLAPSSRYRVPSSNVFNSSSSQYDVTSGNPKYNTPSTRYGDPSNNIFNSPSSQYDISSGSRKYNAPSSRYGVPSNNGFNSPSSQYDIPSNIRKYIQPSSRPGVPSSSSFKSPTSQFDAPSGSRIYNAPASRYGVPSSGSFKASSSQYEDPSGNRKYNAPTSRYGVPSSNVFNSPSQYDVPSGSRKYTPPLSRYGVPSSGASNVPSSQFDFPSGSSKYTVTKAPSSQYGGPSNRVYNAPPSQYGVPVGSTASDVPQIYGPPSSGSGNNGLPVSSDSYKTRSEVGTAIPSARYGVSSGSGSSRFNKADVSSTPYRSSSASDEGSTLSGDGTRSGQPEIRASSVASKYKNGGYAQTQSYQDPMFEPANYQFSYQVKDEATLTDFGHQETRRDEETKGSFYVLLPDGRNQVVDYEANPNGYMPTIRYEDTGRVAPKYSRDPTQGPY